MSKDWADTIDSILEPLLRLDDRLGQELAGCSTADFADVAIKHGWPLGLTDPDYGRSVGE